MASLIPGYNYDIFISYRQKDNKYDGWVTEFVDNLKKELEATFKEEVSVYFDINPHDGLLETHDVDASLKEKLKCLIFIPIVSRTYCDPKSFAWEHEFKAFVGQASQDKFGLKVKLSNGNVANRVLPVRIHDLDIADIKECESVLGSVLRGVEFIYKESGINRSLSSKDHEEKNLNHTNYRNQINKVALAIKEIILGMKAEPTMAVKESSQHRKLLDEVEKEEGKEEQKEFFKFPKRKILVGLAILALLIVAAIFAYPKIFNKNTLEKLRLSGERISVAVMPFQNLTNDTIWNVWQNGIQNEMISYLSNFSEELKVRQIEFINSLLLNSGFNDYASITPSEAGKIAQKLDANIFIYGSIKKAGKRIRVNTQVIDQKTNEILNSTEIEGLSDEKEIFSIIDSLKKKMKDFLIISKLGNEISPEIKKSLNDLGSTSSPEAYRYFIYGINAVYKLDLNTAMNMFSQSIAIDSNFFTPSLMLAELQMGMGMVEQGKKLMLRNYKYKDLLPLKGRINIEMVYSSIFESPREQIKYLNQLLAIDDKDPFTYLTIGVTYFQLKEYDKAVPEFEKAREIFNKLNLKQPQFAWVSIGIAYHKTGEFKKEKKLYDEVEKEDPDIGTKSELLGEGYSFNSRQAIALLSLGRERAANKYIEKCIKFREKNSASAAVIKNGLATIYSEADILDKAEKYYREALSLEPENQYWLNNLAWFLIDKDININEGLELSNKSLGISRDNWAFLDTKGWGLFKQGKYEEAIEILRKSLDLTPPLSGTETYLHLEAVKKAVAAIK